MSFILLLLISRPTFSLAHEFAWIQMQLVIAREYYRAALTTG